MRCVPLQPRFSQAGHPVCRLWLEAEAEPGSKGSAVTDEARVHGQVLNVLHHQPSHQWGRSNHYLSPSELMHDKPHEVTMGGTEFQAVATAVVLMLCLRVQHAKELEMEHIHPEGEAGV